MPVNVQGNIAEDAKQLEESMLWAGFMRRKDKEARAKLILYYLPFARQMARSVQRSTGTDYLSEIDLVQLATVGLIEAVDRFDPVQGVPFRAFAEKRVRGAVLNGIADMSEMHAQLSYRRKMRRDRLQILSAEGRQTKHKEVFAEMVEMALGLAVGFMLEGTPMFHDDEGRPAVSGYSEGGGELAARSDMFRTLLGHLQDMERVVLELHYLHNVQFSEIAQNLGLTKGRISQLHSRALKSLRELAKARPGLDLRI